MPHKTKRQIFRGVINFNLLTSKDDNKLNLKNKKEFSICASNSDACDLQPSLSKFQFF